MSPRPRTRPAPTRAGCDGTLRVVATVRPLDDDQGGKRATEVRAALYLSRLLVREGVADLARAQQLTRTQAAGEWFDDADGRHYRLALRVDDRAAHDRLCRKCYGTEVRAS